MYGNIARLFAHGSGLRPTYTNSITSLNDPTHRGGRRMISSCDRGAVPGSIRSETAEPSAPARPFLILTYYFGVGVGVGEGVGVGVGVGLVLSFRPPFQPQVEQSSLTLTVSE